MMKHCKDKWIKRRKLIGIIIIRILQTVSFKKTMEFIMNLNNKKNFALKKEKEFMKISNLTIRLDSQNKKIKKKDCKTYMHIKSIIG